MDYRWLHSMRIGKDYSPMEAIYGFKTFVPQRTSRIVPTILAYIGGKQLNSRTLMSMSSGHRSGIKEQEAEVVHLNLVSNLHSLINPSQLRRAFVFKEVI